MASVAYNTPGVYIQEDASLALSINHSASAIPVFIGNFRNSDGTLPAENSCTRVTSWLDFTNHFFTAPLAVMLNAAAEQGKYTFTADIKILRGPVAVQHYFNNGGGPCYILPIPRNPDELAPLASVIEQQREITLLLCPETADSLPESVDKQQIYTSLNTLLQKQAGYFLLADSRDGSADIPTTQADQTAVYYPDLITPWSYTLPDEQLIIIEGYSGVNRLSMLAEKNPEDYLKARQVIADALKSLALPARMTLPPSAAVAGAYCTNDNRRGVWKAPANLTLNSAQPTVVITDAQQETLNQKGVNAIRQFSGKGTLIWGARTQDKSDDWRYIPVRRLFNQAERDIRKAMQSAVFENNAPATWEAVRSAIDSYLHRLWQQGALMGNKPEEAWFVHIGVGITMTKEDIQQGRMIVKIGMAAVRPAEFIILQFTQNINQ